ncbi:uncharacterized protein P884DRAFT_304393, partial [Thermothelomyces heterothallicus CBS 202.75]|uniref:uncharacterized protein n=1 Tax=Thermothelomyces heterothallicus CBS 202.75 TaxID=1149848 RepID=UPI0037441C14
MSGHATCALLVSDAQHTRGLAPMWHSATHPAQALEASTVPARLRHRICTYGCYTEVAKCFWSACETAAIYVVRGRTPEWCWRWGFLCKLGPPILADPMQKRLTDYIHYKSRTALSTRPRALSTSMYEVSTGLQHRCSLPGPSAVRAVLEVSPIRYGGLDPHTYRLMVPYETHHTTERCPIKESNRFGLIAVTGR